MLRNAADTNILFYLMIAVGVIGTLSKLVSQFTLHRMVKAAENMSKSKHKLMKLVLAEYEQAGKRQVFVENVLVFIRKYLYEYRGFLFRIHTWRQLEIQSVWFSGILALLGAAGQYLAHGFCEEMFQYAALGAAEMILLAVISQLTDEAYQINGIEIYMSDYLDNVCSHRYQKGMQTEGESVRKVHPKAASAGRTDITDTQQHTETIGEDLSERKEKAIRLILAEYLA